MSTWPPADVYQMVMKVKPTGMLLMMPAGWINRRQQDVITYLKEENKIPQEQLGAGISKIRESPVQNDYVL